MTHLLEQAIAKLQMLPEQEQDTIARMILEDVEDNHRWDAAFAATQDPLARVAQKVRADIAVAGRTHAMGFDEL